MKIPKTDIRKSQFYLGKTDDIPPCKLPEHRVISSLFNVINESPFEMVN